MRKWLVPVIALTTFCLLAAFLVGCVEKPSTPLMYTPKFTISVQGNKLMIYLRPSMGNFVLYQEVKIKIDNKTVFNKTNVPGTFFVENASYGILNLSVYVKYVDSAGNIHIYEKKYTLRIGENGIIVNGIFYGKEYTKFLPEVKGNVWKI